MEIHELVDKKKEIYNLLLEYIENQSDFNDEYIQLTIFFETHKIGEDQQELKEILHLLLKISNNHYRYPNFFSKIEQILSFFDSKIKQTFSNFEIFHQFKSNKRILHFLFQKKIILPDPEIVQYILRKSKGDYSLYFYPEIKKIIEKDEMERIENELYAFDENIFTNFEEKRQIGENEALICQLVRNDLIEDFISHVNQTNVSFSMKIKKSIFETNPFLIDKEPSLIEYSAFYGSIQIFRYLFNNQTDEVKSSIWQYAIHGKNPEIFHFLEEKRIEPEDKSFKKCLEESIKCHHNEISKYIQNNLIKNEADSLNYELNFDENIFAYSFHYYNYIFFPYELINKYFFGYLCEYNHLSFIELLLKCKELNINATIVPNHYISNNVSILF